MLSKLFWTLTSLFIIILILGFIAIFFDLLNSNFNKTENAVSYKAKEVKKHVFNDKKLKVMTWNIKFAAARIDMFFDCHGDREVVTKNEVITNLKNISKKIKEINPDVLFLQEVDIKSHRTSNVDQAQFILDNTELNYGYYASQWKSWYIPSNNIKHINTGNLILSKYPMKNAKRYSLPLIKSQNLVVQYFYLKRNFLVADIELNNNKIKLLNTHLSAFASDETKTRQVNQIEDFTNNLNQNKEKFILGGDFNLIPPQSKKVKDFPDSICKGGKFEANDFSKEIEWLSPLYNNFKSAINLGDYQDNNEKYFTHTTDKKGFWTRKLDYIFSNGKLRNGETLQKNTMSLSDHAPIIVEYILD